MKRIAVILITLIASLSIAKAQDREQIAKIISRLDDSRITLSYACTVKGEIPLTLSGTLTIQGQCYLAKGNGVELYCDGTSRWTVDREAREIYIEKAESVQELLLYTDQIADLSLTDVKYLPKGDASEFTFVTEGLDKSWVITDLRTVSKQ